MMKTVQNMATLFSVLGCLNYGIIAVFDFDVLQHALFNFPAILKILYFLMGLSSFILILQIQPKEK